MAFLRIHICFIDEKQNDRHNGQKSKVIAKGFEKAKNCLFKNVKAKRSQILDGKGSHIYTYHPNII